MPLTLALHPHNTKPAGPVLYIEDAKPGLNIRPGDFNAFKRSLRVFLDDLRHLRFLDHIQTIDSSNLSPEEAQRLIRYKLTADEVVKEIKASFGSYSDSWIGIKNLFLNKEIILNKPDISHINTSKPFDAVVISAGPSLDREIDRLKELKSKVLLIAVDAALKNLLHNDIEPDFVVVIERDEHSIPFISNLPPHIKTTLVAHPLVDQKIFSIYPGKIVTALKYTGPCLWFPLNRQSFWTASSSAHLAYRLAAHLGASRIALVGQDLCFHPETFQSHSQNSDYPEWSKPSTKEEKQKNEVLIEAKGNNYSKVFTTPTWKHFAHDYELIFNEVKTPTINTSHFGMKLEGIEFESLESWIKNINSSCFKIQIPDTNPNEIKDRKALTSKTNDAMTCLNDLREKISQSKRVNPLAVYSQILETRHFLELVFELVFNDWVLAENIVHHNTIEASSAAQEFLTKSETAIEQVLQLLRETA